MTLQETAERELRDALVRYFARIRHQAAPTLDVLESWHNALAVEHMLVDAAVEGLRRYGTAAECARAFGLDSVKLGKKMEREIARTAEMLELTDPAPRKRGEHP